MNVKKDYLQEAKWCILHNLSTHFYDYSKSSLQKLTTVSKYKSFICPSAELQKSDLVLPFPHQGSIT